MQIKHNNILPGMINEEVEFFAESEGKVKAIHNGTFYAFNELPKWILTTLERAYAKSKESFTDLQQFTYKYFGGLDNVPDIDANGRLNYTEELDYKKGIPVGNGETLSAAEIRYIQHLPLEDQEIANKLFLSINTIKSHRQNICRKIGLCNKPELVLWASKKGLI